MNENEFLNVVLQGAGSGDYTQAVQSGAAWEVFAQVVICKFLMAGYKVLGREISYPHSGEKLDIAFTLGQVTYLIELKVESATHAGVFAGQTLKKAFETDSEKLFTFELAGAKRWVLIIAWSPNAKESLSRMAEEGDSWFTGEENGFLAALFDIDA